MEEQITITLSREHANGLFWVLRGGNVMHEDSRQEVMKQLIRYKIPDNYP